MTEFTGIEPVFRKPNYPDPGHTGRENIEANVSLVIVKNIT